MSDNKELSKRIYPLFDRIAVVRDEAERMTKGGLHIADNAQEKPQGGTVVAVGTGKWEAGEVRLPIVRVGQRVLFGKYSGSEIDIDGTTITLMKEDEVMAILREGNDDDIPF